MLPKLDPERDVLFEDNHLLIVNKPFGMLSQGDDTGDDSVVEWAKAYIKEKYNKPGNVYLGLIHRLDRPAGGALVLARTSKAAARVSKQFQGKEVQKIYHIVTEGVPKPAAGTLSHHIRKLPNKNIVRAHPKPVDGAKPAKLEYRVLSVNQGKALVEIRLITGRRHQIRAQMATKGTPVLGDVKYGASGFLPDQDIALLAREVSLVHPTQKEPLTVTAPWPDKDWWKGFQLD
ncbi:RluA family pseudouridine synthase [Pontibacter sp. G13]|uniref:RluA family pseudouridine synthase n=1 Tax=Pontibacter sp. G13 TaxID=3074898 RepID=UPI002889DA8F|nr:RluA family pseudouridine synthase [Pontibacter sp. G13]WNJ21019.1 RluA family pseudouridine synthase [Pontibacter sp. G13]